MEAGVVSLGFEPRSEAVGLGKVYWRKKNFKIFLAIIGVAVNYEGHKIHRNR